MKTQDQKNNKYTFTVNDINCECIFKPHDTYIKLPEKQIMLLFSSLAKFKQSGFMSMPVGFVIKHDGVGTSIIKEEVQAHKVNNLIEIGCEQLTQEQFNKLYNLIKFKRNEFSTRQSGI